MNYARVLLIVGLLIILVPFLGIPLLWKHIVTIALGMIVIMDAVLIRASTRRRSQPVRTEPESVSRAPRRRTTAAVRTRTLASRIHQETPTVPVITSESLVDHDEA